MKIALLNTYRVIQGRGGAEKVFCELANGFAQCGHEVLALAYDEAEGRPFYPLDSRVIFMNTWSGRNVLLSVGSSSKTPVTKPDGTKMFRSVFLNDARRCCFFYQHNSKILL